MWPIRVLIDRGAMSIFIPPGLRPILGLPHENEHTTTLGLDGQVMEHGRDSRILTISGQYFNHVAPVDQPEVLVILMKAYNLALGQPWFRARNRQIDWSENRLSSSGMASGSGLHGTADTQHGQA